MQPLVSLRVEPAERCLKPFAPLPVHRLPGKLEVLPAALTIHVGRLVEQAEFGREVRHAALLKNRFIDFSLYLSAARILKVRLGLIVEQKFDKIKVFLTDMVKIEIAAIALVMRV